MKKNEKNKDFIKILLILLSALYLFLLLIILFIFPDILNSDLISKGYFQDIRKSLLDILSIINKTDQNFILWFLALINCILSLFISIIYTIFLNKIKLFYRYEYLVIISI